MQYEIQALKVGTLDVPGPEVYYMKNFFEWVPLAVWMFVVRGGGKTIVVDCGLNRHSFSDANDILGPWLGERATFKVGPGEDVPSALARVGVKPEEVDYCILTHLHVDHDGNADYFPNAKIVINKKGWAHFHAPKIAAMAPRFQIPRSVLTWLVTDGWGQVHLAEDEEEILPGIRVFWIGGHTTSAQAVCVDTAKGSVIMPGDTIFKYENIEQNIPIGMLESYEETMLAMERIRGEAAIVLPGHEINIPERHPEGKIA